MEIINRAQGIIYQGRSNIRPYLRNLVLEVWMDRDLDALNVCVVWLEGCPALKKVDVRLQRIILEPREPVERICSVFGQLAERLGSGLSFSIGTGFWNAKVVGNVEKLLAYRKETFLDEADFYH